MLAVRMWLGSTLVQGEKNPKCLWSVLILRHLSDSRSALDYHCTCPNQQEARQ